MKVSVVILNWNGCDMLRTFLPSVVRYSKGEGVEVCVADNGSTDASVEMLRQDFPSVRVILLDQNHGFADGYNLALQQVEADYVVLLNSDVEVTEHWLEPMIAYLDIHPEVAACQPKIRSWRQKDHFEYAGAAGGFLDKYGYPFCRGRIMGVVEKDEGQYDKAIPVFWATGAALVIRRADYKDAIRELERVVLLKVIDRKWMDHIDDMEQLRQGVGLQAYGQRDPLVEYKMSGYEMFDEMTQNIREETVRLLFHIKIEQKVEREQQAKITGTNKDDSLPKGPVKRENAKVYPNDPCPCGSGKKYKNCCGRKA